uniref:Uncharacterized protein n=1 Tax=Rhizophora mucronata TaxID=61149 RepID=A0A2P2PCB1_RHIMU
MLSKNSFTTTLWADKKSLSFFQVSHLSFSKYKALCFPQSE